MALQDGERAVLTGSIQNSKTRPSPKRRCIKDMDFLGTLNPKPLNRGFGSDMTKTACSIFCIESVREWPYFRCCNCLALADLQSMLRELLY